MSALSTVYWNDNIYVGEWLNCISPESRSLSTLSHLPLNARPHSFNVAIVCAMASGTGNPATRVPFAIFIFLSLEYGKSWKIPFVVPKTCTQFAWIFSKMYHKFTLVIWHISMCEYMPLPFQDFACCIYLRSLTNSASNLWAWLNLHYHSLFLLKIRTSEILWELEKNIGN